MSSSKQIQLFLSHASEDKPLVEPLAQALLNAGFRVWFDKYMLTLGDSLLRKISQGLLESDYGVVVFSPSFFRKNWPQAELDGLYALEASTRKVILPVWKDVDYECMKRHSPILAGRMAVSMSEGVEKVVAEISRAVGVGERSRELATLPAGVAAVMELDRELHTQRISEDMQRSEEGAVATRANFETLFDTFHRVSETLADTARSIKLKVNRTSGELRGHVLTGTSALLSIELLEFYTNNVSSCVLRTRIIKRSRDFSFGQRGGHDETFWESEFRPAFTAERELRWREGRRMYTTQDLVDLCLKNLSREIKRLNGG